MIIKLIDIFVHPDFYQMSVPHLPLHERQLVLREKWEQRIDVLKERKDALLLYFSYMTLSKINQVLKDLSSITNKIEQEEIERIKRCKAKLGNRLILFGWFEIPDSEDLTRIFASRGFTYNPEEVKIHAYGEIFEICMTAWSTNTALALDIPYSNIEYSREDSLTKADCNEIDKWRIYRMTNLFI